MTLRSLSLLVVLAVSGCESTPADAPAPEAEPSIQDVMMQCISGNLDEALPRLDSLDSAAPSDVFAVRAMCYQQRFAADSTREDAETALQNLDQALAVSDSGAIFGTPELHSRRAFIQLSLDPTDFAGALVDFERAVELDSLRPGYRLDRGIARGASGDEAGARTDLTWVIDNDNSSDDLRDVARQRLAGLE